MFKPRVIADMRTAVLILGLAAARAPIGMPRAALKRSPTRLDGAVWGVATNRG